MLSKEQERQEILLQVITLRQLYKHTNIINKHAISVYVEQDPLYPQCKSLIDEKEGGKLLEIIQKLSDSDVKFNSVSEEFELVRDLKIDEKSYPEKFFNVKKSPNTRLFSLEVYQLAAVAIKIDYKKPKDFFEMMYSELGIERKAKKKVSDESSGTTSSSSSNGSSATSGGSSSSNHSIVIENQLDELFEIFPSALSEHIKAKCGQDLNNLIEIVMDLKRPLRLYFYHRDEKDDSFIIDSDIMEKVCESLVFGQDDRAGISGTLHRISRINSRVNKIIGLTIRIGRAVVGIGEIFRDILNDPTGSSGSTSSQTANGILLVGVPNSGKSTLIRDLSRVLSETNRVVIVDTSCEIAGLGDVAHSAVGDSRRIPVKEPKQQKTEMLRAVQNHSPQVIVIDEIGSREEVQTCRTISQRGVRLCASAHGSLESLLVNPILRDLLGGVSDVTVGDKLASQLGGQKIINQMKGTPIFSVIIEVKKNAKSGDTEWVIYKNVKETIRSILDGKDFTGSVRSLKVPNDLSSIVNKETIFQPTSFN